MSQPTNISSNHHENTQKLRGNMAVEARVANQAFYLPFLWAC